jgi:hypothetical protein
LGLLIYVIGIYEGILEYRVANISDWQWAD